MSGWIERASASLKWYERLYHFVTRDTIWAPMPWHRCWCCKKRAEWRDPSADTAWCMPCKYGVCEDCNE